MKFKIAENNDLLYNIIWNTLKQRPNIKIELHSHIVPGTFFTMNRCRYFYNEVEFFDEKRQIDIRIKADRETIYFLSVGGDLQSESVAGN